jgi:hypothetical protein
MPSTSKKQHNFMAAVANNPSFAKKVGVPQSVGKDFTTADKGRKFSKGGDTMASKMNAGFMAMMAKKKGAPAKWLVAVWQWAKLKQAPLAVMVLLKKAKPKARWFRHENGRQSLLIHDGQPWDGGHLPL